VVFEWLEKSSGEVSLSTNGSHARKFGNKQYMSTRNRKLGCECVFQCFVLYFILFNINVCVILLIVNN